jgi:hypothetical protein
VGYFLKNPTINGTKYVLTRKAKAQLAALAYRVKNPTTRGWRRFFGRGSNRNNCAITAIATPNPPAGSSAPQNQQVVQLLPMEITRETTPGSGDFEPIQDNGLSTNSTLPVFASETGEGSSETDYGPSNMTAVLSVDLSSTSTATVNITYTTSGGSSYTGTLTETGAGTGIFKDSGGTNVLTLTPTNQTTSSSAATTLSATVTIPSLSVSSQPVTLAENNALTYQSVTMLTDLSLSGSLSTTAINTIAASFRTTATQPQGYTATFTETAINSRIFRDSTASTTITMTGYTGGTTMNVSVSTNEFSPSSFSAALSETGTGSLVFSNYQRVISSATQDTPATDGQGVFYVQLPGTTATSITLQDGSNQVTVSATPVSGQPGMLRTPKLALLEAGDTFSGGGITTLSLLAGTSGANPNVMVQVYGQTVMTPATKHNAFLGWCYPESPNGGPVHLGKIANILTQNLGWTAPTIHGVMVKPTVLAEMAQHSLWYSFGHGDTPQGKYDQPPLNSFLMWDTANPTTHKQDDLYPSDVATANGTNIYKLVFFNSCFSADMSSGSAAPAFAANFNAQEYVGWSAAENPITATYASYDFFNALQKRASVKDAITTANNNLNKGASFLSNLLNGTGGVKLQTIVDKGVTIDMSGSAPH